MFMIHKEHGAINVSDGEAVAHEKNGWIRATTDDWFRMNGKEHLCQKQENLKLPVDDHSKTDAYQPSDQPKKRGPKPKIKETS